MWWLLALALALAGFGGGALLPGDDVPPAGPAVRVGEAEFLVELAITTEEKTQGLSDRPSLAPDTGMLFVYQSEGRPSFWMRNMHFPLDILWIGQDCTVVDASLGVPLPGQTLAQLPTYSPSVPTLHVLEINAGEAAANGVQTGDAVEFTGDIAGLYGC